MGVLGHYDATYMSTQFKLCIIVGLRAKTTA